MARVRAAAKGAMWHVGVAEYIVSQLTVEEVEYLVPFYERFKLPFARLEPPVLSPRYDDALRKIPTLCAYTATHRYAITAKKVAVLVSGDFRSPDANVRALRQFIAGVDCDVFIHYWEGSRAAGVRETLSPRAIRSEPRPASQAPALDENHTRGETASAVTPADFFNGFRSSLEMAEQCTQGYEFVVHLRPDLYIQQSLKELLYDIAELPDYSGDVVYVPNGFHGLGVNTHLTIFRIPALPKLLDITAAAIEQNHDAPAPSSAEYHYLAGLLAAEFQIVSMPLNYVLLGDRSPDLEALTSYYHQQQQMWASRALAGTWEAKNLTEYFRAKERAARPLPSRDRSPPFEIEIDPSVLPPGLIRSARNARLRLEFQREGANPDVSLFLRIDRWFWTRRFRLAVGKEGLERRTGGAAFVYVQTDSGEVSVVGPDDDLKRMYGPITIGRVDSLRGIQQPSTGSLQRLLVSVYQKWKRRGSE
jgi:hypothetical protein